MASRHAGIFLKSSIALPCMSDGVNVISLLPAVSGEWTKSAQIEVGRCGDTRRQFARFDCDAIEYKFLSAPLSKEQLAEAIQIPALQK
jgi:hypothetical protein